MVGAPPLSSTFITMEDFEKDSPAEPVAADNNKSSSSMQRIDDGSLPSPVRTDGASTPASSFTAPQPETINWVGLLMEYAAQKGNTPPAFSDIPQIGHLEPRFACTVKIDEQTEPFGDSFQTFPRKKLAKQFACQLAMTWLSDNGYISPSRVPKQPSPSSPATQIEPLASVASRVPDLCNELGITPPAYRFTSTPDAPMVWSGYAVFPLNAEIEGRVGEFRNEFGKKNAKEVCARRVLEFLEEFKRRQQTSKAT